MDPSSRDLELNQMGEPARTICKSWPLVNASIKKRLIYSPDENAIHQAPFPGSSDKEQVKAIKQVIGGLEPLTKMGYDKRMSGSPHAASKGSYGQASTRDM